MKRKVYFGVYDGVYSMSRSDAIKLAEKASITGHFDLMDYETSKELKKNQSGSTILVSGVHREVHRCLDWDKEDWKRFLSELKEEV